MKYFKSAITHLTWVAFAAAFMLSSPPTKAQSFKEGEDYVTLQGDGVVLPDGRIEVIEFFWFGCPSCFRFETVLHAWQKPDTIHFVTVPAVLNRTAEFHAHVYYAMELLNLEQQLMAPFYDELHIKRNRVRNAEELETWAATQPGIDAEKIVGTVNSFAARTKVSQADLFANQFGVSSVPNLVVGRKYRTSPSMAGSFARSLQVVEHLVEKILAEQ